MTSSPGPALETRYRFIPSVRRGYLPARTFSDGPPFTGRTTVGVELTVEGLPVDGDALEEADDLPVVDLRMYGPGDVTGIDQREVQRVHPEPDTTTFPPNYFPLVEFATPDLPWLFSPARPETTRGRARPWLSLVVVPRQADGVTFEVGADGPVLEAPADHLPPAEEAWAWAHVQVTGDLDTGKVKQAIQDGSDQVISRLVCPRNLDARTPYIACVVPLYEPGRRAGLGEEPFEGGGKSQEIDLAWSSGDGGTVTLPVYHHWEFTTGDTGDFESAVRKLTPRDLSQDEVGVRTIDMSDPGLGALERQNGLERQVAGALQSPALDPDPYPETSGGEDKALRAKLRAVLNDPSSMAEASSQTRTKAGSKATYPVVGPPIYGRWYLPEDAGWVLSAKGRPQPPGVPTGGPYFDSWFHDLNVDPRHRIPASYGTRTIQENQENLMEVAWDQFGDLEEANQQIGASQLGELASGRAFQRMASLDQEVVGYGSRVRSAPAVEQEIRTHGKIKEQGGFDGATGDGAAGGTVAVTGAAGLQAGTGNPGGGMERSVPLASPSFRRRTRSGGKLDKAVESPSGSGQAFGERLKAAPPPDGRANLGGRFSRVSDAIPGPQSPSGSGDTSGGTKGDSSGGSQGAFPSGASAPAPAQVTPPPQTGWRTSPAGNVRPLPEAVKNLEEERKPIPKTLIQVESARDHCETARTRIADLRQELQGVDPPQGGGKASPPPDLVTLVKERPAPADHCQAIRRNTFEALDRQLSKLLAADPEALSPDFTKSRKDQLMTSIREAHARLMKPVRRVSGQIRSGGLDLDATRSDLDDAEGALGDIEAGLDAIEAHLDSGVAPGAGPTQATVSAPGRSGGQLVAGTPEVEPVKTRLVDGTDEAPGLLDGSGWAKVHAAGTLGSGILERNVSLGRIMAAPSFERPMYEALKALDQEYLLPGVEEIPRNTLGALETNRDFIEAYMCGLNHEMARELLWRRYPTDRRGTYFQQFWDYAEGAGQLDVPKLHWWKASGLGDNRPASAGGSGVENRVVLLIRGDLLRTYPNTRIYMVKAVKGKRGSGSGAEWDRIPLLEGLREKEILKRPGGPNPGGQNLGPKRLPSEYSADQLKSWKPKEPIFRGKLDPDVTFLGFDLGSAAAEGETMDQSGDTDLTNLGWFFVLEEPVGETRFGFDVPSDGDYGSVPYGITHGPQGNRSLRKMGKTAYNKGREAGWNGLSWGHLVDAEADLDQMIHIGVDDVRPAGGNHPPWETEKKEWTASDAPTSKSWTDADLARWGRNSAHMARIAFQLPVRVCVHADDLLPNLSDQAWPNVEDLTSRLRDVEVRDATPGDLP